MAAIVPTAPSQVIADTREIVKERTLKNSNEVKRTILGEDHINQYIAKGDT